MKNQNQINSWAEITHHFTKPKYNNKTTTKLKRTLVETYK